MMIKSARGTIMTTRLPKRSESHPPKRENTRTQIPTTAVAAIERPDGRCSVVIAYVVM